MEWPTRRVRMPKRTTNFQKRPLSPSPGRDDDEGQSEEDGVEQRTKYQNDKRCRVERSLLWEITGNLAAAGNDLRVGNQLLFSKPKIIIKQTVFNRVHTKDSRPTSSIQR